MSGDGLLVMAIIILEAVLKAASIILSRNIGFTGPFYSDRILVIIGIKKAPRNRGFFSFPATGRLSSHSPCG